MIEENKALLRAKYEEAKALGSAVNSSRAKINKLKAHIEQIRVERAMQGLSAEAGAAQAADPEEERCKRSIEGEKEAYRGAFGRLKELKTEIEHLQLLLEQSRQRLQKDFDGWFLLLEGQAHGAPQPDALGHPPPRDASLLAGSAKGSGPAAHGGGARPVQPQLTGNAEVDAEILAFYQARESLLQSQAQRAVS